MSTTLLVFTQDDINRLVFYLRLPPTERRPLASDLCYRLRWVEDEDARNGTDIAIRIQFLLDELDTLETEINDVLRNTAGSLSSVSQSVNDMYRQDFGYQTFTSGELPQLAGKRDLYGKYVQEIKRELFYVRYDNQLPLDGVGVSIPYRSLEYLALSDYYS